METRTQSGRFTAHPHHMHRRRCLSANGVDMPPSVEASEVLPHAAGGEVIVLHRATSEFRALLARLHCIPRPRSHSCLHLLVLREDYLRAV